VRARLTDGDVVEGLAANDVSLVGSDGVFLTPPDLRSNTQRLWIPRGSIDELEVVAVIGAAKRKVAPVVEKAKDERQEDLFSERSGG
jgi:hypothetical protein